jgi:hypothetical protein
MTNEASPVFSCRQCGECCRGKGGILVTPEEARQLAAFLALPLEEFQACYLVASPLGAQVAAPEGVCIFLTDNRCRVHPVKPHICRQWPFLPVLLADPEELEHAKGACPGIEPACSHAEFVAAAKVAGEETRLKRDQ